MIQKVNYENLIDDGIDLTAFQHVVISPDGSTYYGVNKEGLDQIARFIINKSEDPKPRVNDSDQVPYLLTSGYAIVEKDDHGSVKTYCINLPSNQQMRVAELVGGELTNSNIDACRLAAYFRFPRLPK